MTAPEVRDRRARLPRARGPLSSALIEALTGDGDPRLPDDGLATADPLGDDVQLALTVAYELHYRGFAELPEAYEWEPSLLAFRRSLETALNNRLRQAAAPVTESANDAMDRLSIEPIDGDSASWRLRDIADFGQFRDYFAMRSIYHLKEADPHAWAIPRLYAGAKAAYVAVEYDEYGAGHGAHVHAELFADLLEAAGLNSGYLGYLDAAPAWALLPVNVMSFFGLHRGLRGATVGHFAATEITSPPGSARLLAGLERLDAPGPCRRFYAEHVEADAVHEQILRRQVVGSLLAAEPELEPDVVFGIAAFEFAEDRFDEGLQRAWERGDQLAA